MKQGPSAFVKEHPGITDVLILYNMNTLDSDHRNPWDLLI